MEYMVLIYDLTCYHQKASGGDHGYTNVSGFIPPDLSQLSHAFPSPWTISPEADLVTRQRIRDHLPSREDAQQLCEHVRENAFWQ